MHKGKMFRNALILVQSFFLMISACQNTEAKIQKHLSTAQMKIETGDYDVARIELLNAIKADPSSSQAYLLLGKALAGMKDFNGAARALANANELAPDNREIALEFTRFLMAGRAFNLAEPVLQKWVADHPDDKEFSILLSLTHAYLGNSAGSMEYAMRVVDQDPDDVDAWLNLARVSLINKDKTGVEAALARAERIAPDSLPAGLLRISLLIGQGQNDEAISRMESLTSVNPDRVDLLLQLAGMHENFGKTEKAENLYRHVIDLESNAIALERLGILEYRNDQKQEAIRLWEKSVETAPYSINPRIYLAKHFMNEKDASKAYKNINEAIKYAPQNAEALALRGQIHIVENRGSEAVEDLKMALEIRPGMSIWRLWLIGLQLKSGEIVSARENLKIILDDEPTNAQANVLLARIEANAANFVESSGHALAATSDKVHGREAMWIIGDNALRQQKPSLAKAVHIRNIDRHGPHPGTLLRLARSHESLGELEQAEAGYRQLLRDYPDNIFPLTQLVSIMGRTGREAEALALAREKAASGDFPQKLLLGRILEVTGELREAKDVYLSVVQSHPDMLAPYERIIGLYARESNLEGAQKWLTEEIENAQTPPVRLLVLLGMIRDASGQREKAIDTYRQVLEIDPDFVPVLNNLAWDLSESGELKEALEIATKARKLAPENPSLADTYAWILHKSGDSAGALPALRQAREGLPDNRTVGLHLVEVLEAVGRSEEAARHRELLEQHR